MPCYRHPKTCNLIEVMNWEYCYQHQDDIIMAPLWNDCLLTWPMFRLSFKVCIFCKLDLSKGDYQATPAMLIYHHTCLWDDLDRAPSFALIPGIYRLKMWFKCDAVLVNTLRPRQDGCHFTDDIFKRIFLNENVWISIDISLKFIPKGPIDNVPVLVQIMAWHQPDDKPLSEPMMVWFTDAYMHHSASMS